ncbi:YfgM family protein [Alteromonas facilis]|uniref:YfgM family protein n=1 Tax=Alteromonas facilis TaxID=2048004 RepID=UPI000C2898F5|nr:tetratricopeptide repeat protein [Alteromonas facilis]
MEQFATEEQQVEAIKRFWKENGMAIVVGAVLGLGGLWGWRYYSDSQLAAKEAASLEYQSVIEGLQTEAGLERAKTFLSSNEASGYASLTAMIMAAQAIQSEDLDSAATYLKTATEAQDVALRDMALVRLARVQLAQNDADSALDNVSKVASESFTAQVEEIKGDAYSLKADFVQARLAYGNAVEAAPENRVVKMKLDNLAVASGS